MLLCFAPNFVGVFSSWGCTLVLTTFFLLQCTNVAEMITSLLRGTVFMAACPLLAREWSARKRASTRVQVGAPSIIYCVGSSDLRSFYHGVHSLHAPRVGVCNNVYTTLVPNATPDLRLPLSKYEYKNKRIGEPSTPACFFPVTASARDVPPASLKCCAGSCDSLRSKTFTERRKYCTWIQQICNVQGMPSC